MKMIAPFSDEVMKVTGLNGKANSAKVHFYAINGLVAQLKVMPGYNQARI
ncbi:hypothetical protein ACLK2F_00785 [Escherichia coli]